MSAPQATPRPVDARGDLRLAPGATAERVTEIDLLRFLAALAVVFFHYAYRGFASNDLSVMPYPLLAPVAKYGYLGVELFFMISGFVVLMSASSGSLKKFFISRCVRLYPAFWACCTLTFIVILVLGGRRFSVSPAQYLINMTMLNEFFGVASVDGAYWSLFVEIKFYALVALVLAAGQIHRAELIVWLWLAATVALDIVPLGKLRWLLMVDYAPCFIGGAMAFIIYSRGLTLARFSGLLTAGAAAAHHSVGRAPPSIFEASVVIGLVTLFFALMLLIAVRRTGFVGRRNWLAIGALTYPLYLIHQNVGYMIFNAAYPAINPHVLLWGTLALMIGAAYVVHRWVERPLSTALKRGLTRLMDSGERLLKTPTKRAGS
jgi:peptidoglycan/LPS O-acetylase OafA/YrhL